nr:stage III sporulation protein AF [Heliorestis convoluta]
MIQQVLLIILVGTILDMLMPNSRLQNLVRLVVGLFIMVAILNPLMSMLHHQDWSQTLSQQALPEELVGSYEEIKRQGEDLRQQTWDRAREEARFRLERQIEAVATLKNGIQEAQAQIELDENEEKGIRQIRLHLRDEQGSLFASPSVEPVQIEPIDSESSDSPVSSMVEQEAEQNRIYEKMELSSQLAQTLSSLYGVPVEKIIVTWE